MKMLLLALLFSSVVYPAVAATYLIDKAESAIGFSGTHAGDAFEGSFHVWDADIQFDPEALEASAITVTIDTSSAKTGNSMYDGTLPSKDWFNVKEYPSATFKSETITKADDGTYKAEGTLTLRDVSQPIAFTFPLDVTTSPVTTEFTLPLDRLAYGIGVASDPKAEWVSQEINVMVKVVAEAELSVH